MAVDETYVKVKGRWRYLYRAIDKDSATLDFFLSARRSAKAAKRFLGAALRRSRDWIPRVINTDKNRKHSASTAGALRAMYPPHVGPSDRKPDPHAGWKRNHRRSSAFSTSRSEANSTELPTRTR